MSESVFRRHSLAKTLLTLAGFAVSGCMHPGYAPPPYPMYPAPQMSAPPGSLVIPESNAPPYEPDPPSTYGNDGFHAPEDNVPTPKDPGGDFFGEEYGPGTSLELPRGNYITTAGFTGNVSKTVPQTVETGDSAAFGFDRHQHKWLQGTLAHDELSDQWTISYNPRGDDTYQGRLTLAADAGVPEAFHDGAVVQVRGFVDDSLTDSTGRPMYRTSSVFEITPLSRAERP
ncbi:MAG: hypothetical protein KDA96_00385 [Planctomycetaceae bacterium]|nr:hypothetical protein [Planctomycetaceae bacterium]